MKNLVIIFGLFLNTQCSDQSRRALESFGGQANDLGALGAVDGLFPLGCDDDEWLDVCSLSPNVFVVQSQSQSINQGSVAPAAAAAEEPSGDQLFLNQGPSQPSQQLYRWQDNQLYVWFEHEGKYRHYVPSKEVLQQYQEKQTDVSDRKPQEQPINQHLVAPAAAAAVQEEYKPASSNQRSKKQTKEEKREKHRIARLVSHLKEVMQKHLDAKEYFKEVMNEKDQRVAANKGNPRWLELCQIGKFMFDNIDGRIDRLLYHNFLLALNKYIKENEKVPNKEEMIGILDQERTKNKKYNQKKKKESESEESEGDEACSDQKRYHLRKKTDRKRLQQEDDEDWEEGDEE